MAVDMQSAGLKDRLDYYIRGQATGGLGEYLWQGLWTTLLGGVPGVLGIGLRGLAYRAILKMDGIAAIEAGVRLRCTRNIRLGRGSYLDHGVYVHATPGGVEIGDRTTVMHNTELHVFNFRDLPHAFIRIGSDTFVGESVVVRGQGGVTIGNSVLIAPHVKILAINHTFSDPTRPVIEQGITGRGIVIEDGSWIGAGAVILDGVRIGQGAVVGANAVVSRDVPPHTLVVGSPARVVKHLSGDDRGSRELRSTLDYNVQLSAQPAN
ncbi:MAG: DapH/DapD/GlmU-related protein [Chloroflexota bacterium]